MKWKLGLLAGICSAMLFAQDQKGSTLQEYSAAFVPEYYFSRPISGEELQGRSLRELALMRNVIYARAGNIFRKKWLNDYFGAQWWYQATGLDVERLSEVDWQNSRTIADYEISLSREDLQRRLQEVLDKAQELDLQDEIYSLPEEDYLELFLVYGALGEGVPAAYLPPDYDESVPVNHRSRLPIELIGPLHNPNLLESILQLADLRDYSRRDLRLLRNMIFARRGRIFSSELLNDYFARMDWYKPDQQYRDDRLTEVDRLNVQLISSLEAELGGALSDEEYGQELLWLEGA